MIDKLTVNVGEDTYTFYHAEVTFEEKRGSPGADVRELTIESEVEPYSERDKEVHELIRNLHRESTRLSLRGEPGDLERADAYTDAANAVKGLLHE